jgi:hypothetical protein
MPYPDRQNCWPYDEPAPTRSGCAALGTSLLYVAAIAGALLWLSL